MNPLDRKMRQKLRISAEAAAQHSPDHHCQRMVKLCDLLDTTLGTLKETLQVLEDVETLVPEPHKGRIAFILSTTERFR